MRRHGRSADRPIIIARMGIYVSRSPLRSNTSPKVKARCPKLFCCSQDYISKPGPLLILTDPPGCRVAGINFPYYEPKIRIFHFTGIPICKPQRWWYLCQFLCLTPYSVGSLIRPDVFFFREKCPAGLYGLQSSDSDWS